MKKFITAVLIAATLGGCATPLTQQELNTADYGPFPDNYEEIIKQSFASSLIDPASANYSFHQPVKGGISGNAMVGVPKAFGYVVCGTVNSKNRFGGYAGPLPFLFVLKNGAVSTGKIGEVGSTDIYENFSIANNFINSTCATFK